MIERFFKFYSACFYEKLSLQLDIQHDNCGGWYIKICHTASDTIIFDMDCTSLNLLCAKAYIALAEWASNIPVLEDIENNLE